MRPRALRLAGALSLSLLVAIGGCTSDEVTLSYGIDVGRRLTYSLTLDAAIERTLGDQTRQQVVEASFVADQEILARVPGGGARARMTLRPESLVVDGRRQQPGPAQEFLVSLGEDGRVVEIDPQAEVADESLAPLGLDRLLPRLRPVLPGRPVSPGETWRSTSEFEDPAGRFSLTLRSRLAALGIAQGEQAALVRTTYSSPVRRREIFANAVTDVNGTDVGTQEAWFSLDGFLVRAEGDSVGRYRLTFRPPGGEAGVEPVEGSLRVRLRTQMRLV